MVSQWAARKFFSNILEFLLGFRLPWRVAHVVVSAALLGYVPVMRQTFAGIRLHGWMLTTFAHWIVRLPDYFNLRAHIQLWASRFIFS